MSKKTIYVRAATYTGGYNKAEISRESFTPKRTVGEEVFGHLSEQWVAVELASWTAACAEWLEEDNGLREKEIGAIRARILSEYIKQGKDIGGNINWARSAAVKIYDMFKNC